MKRINFRLLLLVFVVLFMGVSIVIGVKSACTREDRMDVSSCIELEL